MHCKTGGNWPFSGLFCRFSGYFNLRRLSPKTNLKIFLGFFFAERFEKRFHAKAIVHKESTGMSCPITRTEQFHKIDVFFKLFFVDDSDIFN